MNFNLALNDCDEISKIKMLFRSLLSLTQRKSDEYGGKPMRECCSKAVKFQTANCFRNSISGEFAGGVAGDAGSPLSWNLPGVS